MLRTRNLHSSNLTPRGILVTPGLSEIFSFHGQLPWPLLVSESGGILALIILAVHPPLETFRSLQLYLPARTANAVVGGVCLRSNSGFTV